MPVAENLTASYVWANSRLWWTRMKMTLPGSCNVFSCHSQPGSLREQWLFKNSSAAARPLDLHLLVFQQQLSTYGLAVDCWKFLVKAQKPTFWWFGEVLSLRSFFWLSDYVKTLYNILYYINIYMIIIIIEGSLEVKLPTIWTDEKQSRAEAERRGRLEERRSEEKE